MPALRHGYGYVYTDKYSCSGASAVQNEGFPQSALRVEQPDCDVAVGASPILSGTIAPGIPSVASIAASSLSPSRSGFRYGTQHPYLDPRPLNAAGGVRLGHLISQGDDDRSHFVRSLQGTFATTIPSNQRAPHLSALAPAAHLPSSTQILNCTSQSGKNRNHIPRPRNPFICYRTVYRQAHAKLPQQQLSVNAGLAWKALAPAEKAVYEERAKAEKQLHKVLFPEYWRGNKGKKQQLACPSCQDDQLVSLLACIPLDVSPESSVEERVKAFRVAQKAVDGCISSSPLTSPSFLGSEYAGTPSESASPFVGLPPGFAIGDDEQILESALFTISPAASPPSLVYLEHGSAMDNTSPCDLTSATDVPLPLTDPSLWMPSQDGLSVNVDFSDYNHFMDCATPSPSSSTFSASPASAPGSDASPSSSAISQRNSFDLDPIKHSMSSSNLGEDYETDFNYNFGPDYFLSNNMISDWTNQDNLGPVDLEWFDYALCFAEEIGKGKERAV